MIDQIIIGTLLGVALLMCVSSIDDLFVDAVGLGSLAFRKDVACKADGAGNAEHKRPAIGIFVANWHEADVLERMVEGNLASLTYRPLHFFLGVYPNDEATWNAAQAVADRYPDFVTVVVNSRPGPTSKGQLLNVMFAQVYGGGGGPPLAVVHDSEDVIDPGSLDLYGREARTHDFIQIPVYSLESRHRSLVGAHYMEEFAERHSWELVVRDSLRAVIPSAGVGTCVTRRLIVHFIRARGTVFEEGTVTEDYILGAEVHRAGFRSTFVKDRVTSPDGSRVVATREYFPKSFLAAVKQKTRWIYGIAFEGTRKLGWKGSLQDRFFFYRDRKGAITNLLPPLSFALAGTTFAAGAEVEFDNTLLRSAATSVLIVNLFAAAVRFAVKLAAFKHIYGTTDPVGLIVRWPVAILVNFVAVLRAWKTFFGESRFATRPITWAKTDHEIPAHFGLLTAIVPIGPDIPDIEDQIAPVHSAPTSNTMRPMVHEIGNDKNTATIH